MTDLAKFGIYREEGRVHEEVVYSLALLYNVINHEITNFLKDYDLTPGKFNILVAIRHHGGKRGLPQVEVSKHLIVTKSNMTKLLEKLEREGLVSREQLESDKRVNITRVTEKGEKLLDSLWEQYNDLLKNLVYKLDTNKQKQLASLMGEWFGTLVS